MKKIVAIGGGTGLSTFLRGIRDYPIDISAIVTMTDDGASSGKLRRDVGILPPGDIRKCIAALSEDETVLTDLFQYRFRRGLGISGHSVGNLLITALKEMTGSFESAIEGISHILNIKGQVIPTSLTDLDLVATFEDGKTITGESKITKHGYKSKINGMALTKTAKVNLNAIKALDYADVIFVGPGSLYTSIIPNFLPSKMQKSFESSKALKVFICNVSTERGETEGFSVTDHIEKLREYGVACDAVLINGNIFPKCSGDGYVCSVIDDSTGTNITRIISDLANSQNPLYHDSVSLGKAAWRIILSSQKIQKNNKIKPVIY